MRAVCVWADRSRPIVPPARWKIERRAVPLRDHDLAHRSSAVHDLVERTDSLLKHRSPAGRGAIVTKHRPHRDKEHQPSSIEQIPPAPPDSAKAAAISMIGDVFSEAPRPTNPLSRSPGQLLKQHAPSSRHAEPLQEESLPNPSVANTSTTLTAHTRHRRTAMQSRQSGWSPGSWLQSMRRIRPACFSSRRHLRSERNGGIGTVGESVVVGVARTHGTGEPSTASVLLIRTNVFSSAVEPSLQASSVPEIESGWMDSAWRRSRAPHLVIREGSFPHFRRAAAPGSPV